MTRQEFPAPDPLPRRSHLISICPSMASSWTLHDRVYGTHQITSDVIPALIASQPLQRMAGIGQFGIPDEFYHKQNFSRLEHCIGTMLLLRKLGASEEEQIAGLLHDISHTAFSHLIDWVVGSGRTEDYQDQHHQNMILHSEIVPLLEQHGYNPTRLADYHHFPLLERDAPDLCADRVDYAFRELPLEISRRCLAHLAVHEQRIIFTDLFAALLFARSFLALNTTHWAGYEATSRYRFFALILKLSLGYGLITFTDLWRDDAHVVAKLKAAAQPDIQYLLSILRHPTLADFPRTTETTRKKFRYVNPMVMHAGICQRLSALDQTFAEEIERARRDNERGVYTAALPIDAG